MKICNNCGNPLVMYWCTKCESNSESTTCENCGFGCDIGQALKEDKDYHLNCNK